jgi:acetyltransferase-like isoleucine patch superfamily enzyme
MIPAYVDRGQGAGRPLFRGRDAAYWIEQSVPGRRFLTAPPPRGGGLILVFSAGRFPLLGVAALRALRRLDRGAIPSAAGLFAPPGKPFFAVSRARLRKEGLRLEPGLFRRLLALPGCAFLDLGGPVPALDPGRDSLAVEAAVVALQVGRLERAGVRVEDRGRFYMEGLPAVGRGTSIGPGVVLRGDCRIGRNVAIHANCCIENSRVGDGCRILAGSLLSDSLVERGAQLGPYCHLRLGSRVRRGAKIGNFVEMKKSDFGAGSKAMHLSYLGDATVGRSVNVGAGTITCNYDGVRKNPTRIGDNAFIGSGSELVAPVVVQADSYVAAGSTVTEDVPRHALAVARQRQRNIQGWVLRKRAKKS